MRGATPPRALLLALALGTPFAARATEESWSCQVSPPEREVVTEPESGARTVFVTTSAADDSNLYFHDRSWIADGSLLVFYSDRAGRRDLFGYVEATGEIVRIGPPDDPGGAPLDAVTCSRRGSIVYAIRGRDVLALTVDLAVQTSSPTRASVRARQVCAVPKNGGLRSALNESSDGRLLALGLTDPDRPGTNRIAAIEVETGKVSTVTEVQFPVSHVQFSWTRPDLVLFARTYPEGDRVPERAEPGSEPHARLWLADLSGKPAWPVFWQKPGELVTHECWWTEDRFTFCGGHRPHESHLKVYDLKSGRISILGAGSWRPEASAEEITKRAWWHASGSPDGRWAAADTFHGDVVLFDAATAEERPLSRGHRVFGSNGAHPHVGWAPSSDRVVYASNVRGNPDVVVTGVPAGWR
ncbi:MAG: PD40 domain-containing protein [Planctomycetes bacterium]|nr:PD40 domain-containing protein [Planctomycetota bacterium]